MRKLDITPISDTQEFPVKRGTLQFLQDSYAELFQGIMRSLLSPTYNPSTCYILYGMINAATAPIYNVTDGLCFLGGELFFMQPTSFTALGSNVGVLQEITTQYTIDADPVTFTNEVEFNVHNIRGMQLVSAPSGSGLVDFSAVQYVSFVIPKQLNAEQSGILTITGTYPDLVFDVPASSNLHPCTGGGTVNIGDVPGGGVTIPVVFGSAGQAPAQTAPYYVMITQVSVGGSPQQDTTVIITVIDSTRNNSGFSLRCQEMVAGVQSLKVEYLLFAK